MSNFGGGGDRGERGERGGKRGKFSRFAAPRKLVEPEEPLDYKNVG